MDVVALAPRALSCPHPYDPANEVLVQLDEPLWLPRAREQEVAVEILSLCVQMDCVLLSTKKMKEKQDREESDLGSDRRPRSGEERVTVSDRAKEQRKKRVTFEKVLAGKVTSIWHQMEEQLSRVSIHSDLQAYLRERGLLRLFPRLERYLKDPEATMTTTTANVTSIVDDYLGRLTHLHGVKSLALQLHSSALSVQHHKYIAHITAVLYQILCRHPHLVSFRKEIEVNFPTLKACCLATPSGHPPKLQPELKTWLLEFCNQLMERTLTLSSDLLASNASAQEVLRTIS